MNKTSLRADLDNGVTIIAHHFPGYGSRAGWEVQVVYLTANRYLEKIQTLYNDDVAATQEVMRRIVLYSPMRHDSLMKTADSLIGCEYEGCEKVNDKCPGHDKATDPVFTLCDTCSKPCIGWRVSAYGKSTCYDCYKASPDYNEKAHHEAPAWRRLSL